MVGSHEVELTIGSSEFSEAAGTVLLSASAIDNDALPVVLAGDRLDEPSLN